MRLPGLIITFILWTAWSDCFKIDALLVEPCGFGSCMFVIDWLVCVRERSEGVGRKKLRVSHPVSGETERERETRRDARIPTDVVW